MTGSGSVVMGFSQKEDVIDQCVRHFHKRVRFVRKTKILKHQDLEVKTSSHLFKV